MTRIADYPRLAHSNVLPKTPEIGGAQEPSMGEVLTVYEIRVLAES